MLDANLLVRGLTQDDTKQAALTTALIDAGLTAASPGFISLVVLTELYWVLANAYSVKPAKWLVALDDLLGGYGGGLGWIYKKMDQCQRHMVIVRYINYSILQVAYKSALIFAKICAILAINC